MKIELFVRGGFTKKLRPEVISNWVKLLNHKDSRIWIILELRSGSERVADGREHRVRVWVIRDNGSFLLLTHLVKHILCRVSFGR